MNKDIMNEAVGLIDFELVEAADSRPEKTKVTAFKPWMKYAVAAVLLAVFAIGTPVALNMAGVFGTNNVVDPASSSGSGSDVSEIIYPPEDDSHSTVSEPPQPITPASPGSYEEPYPDLPHGGDNRIRLTNFMYSDDRLTSFTTMWHDYITEQAGEDISTLFKTDWRTVQGAAFSLIEIVDELKIPKEKFVELNSRYLEEIRATNYFTEEMIFSDYCFTDEEIDIIYSGDKKRIAEAFANPYAVIADDWEIYPLRWIIDNPASAYKDRHISLDALETAAYKLIDQG
ncbi:MAG: hypothetical protein IKX98_03430, partial [Clostridia bacterium]|nr:hypothetical protein [Clostridia bacterium]